MRAALSTLFVALVALAIVVPAGTPLAPGSLAQGLVPGGTIRIGTPRQGGRTYDVAALQLEPYIARVLAGEALPGSEPAALEALAIAIRTYAAGNMGRHRSDGFDLCDTTHCQVTRAATPQSERAAQSTAGQVLLYNGAPATIFYSASCGGRTELASAVWPGMNDQPYLPSRPDDGCGGDPVWRAEIALADLQRSFRAAGYRGTLRDMRILSRNASGRVALLALDGLTPSQITGQDLREAVGGTLGWQHVRSTLFELRRARDAFRFDGRGFGHGVGMCVIGSAKLAVSGETALAILQRYFPGTIIGSASTRAPGAPIAPPPVQPQITSTEKAPPVAVSGILVLADDDPADRQLVQETAVRARDDLSKTLGVAAPALIRVQAYRTADDYERATGRPWFTFGAVAGGDIHLMPVHQLAERGTLETTVRRQIVHLLTDAVLAKRPAWVREGAALYYADGALASTSVTNLGKDSCPMDTEFSRPRSPGALGTAYAQARGCFARQVANGRSWRDVK